MGGPDAERSGRLGSGLDVERILGLVDRFDDRVDTLFEKLRGRPWADRVFYTASQLGDYGLIWLLLAALAALGGSWRAERNLVRLAAVLGLDSMFVNGLLKSLIKRSRPIVDDGERPLYLRSPITTAFPSGHASSAVVAAMLLGELGGRRWRGLLRLLAATVALSRIHVRIHHASDVAGGAVAVRFGDPGAQLSVRAKPMVAAGNNRVPATQAGRATADPCLENRALLP